jgi:predicted transcriptional regulator
VRYVYLPRASRETASRSALERVVSTFFQGSVTQAMAALLESADAQLSDLELNRLQQLIKEAKKEGH